MRRAIEMTRGISGFSRIFPMPRAVRVRPGERRRRGRTPRSRGDARAGWAWRTLRHSIDGGHPRRGAVLTSASTRPIRPAPSRRSSAGEIAP
jgi:hypothetical protein